MFKNYIKTAWRSLSKNKLYSAINIFGLAIGLATCLLIGVYINYERSYDKFNANASRIVRATMEYEVAGTINEAATTGTKVGPQFKRTFPEIEEYVRTFIRDGVVKSGNKFFNEPRILYADPHFFKVFSFKIVEGNAATALDATDKIVITQSIAKKIFKNEGPLGKTLIIRGKDLRVSAVCGDAPQNSQIKFDFVTQFLNIGNGVDKEQWWTANWVTYFLLHDKNNIAQLQRQVSDYMKTREVRKEARLEGNSYLTYHLEPLTKVHLYSSLSGFEPNGSITYIYMFSVIALLILIIACVNYTNLATAQSSGRSGEIGMRKVMGASKRQVFMQFIGESSFITFVATLVAFVLAISLIPYFNDITGIQFATNDLLKPIPVISLLLFSLFVSFFAGLYPALVLSGTQIMGVLKKGFSFTGGNNFLRKALIVAQFGISVFLIIYTIIIFQQMHFMQTKNLGYDKDHLVVLPIGGNMLQNFQSIKDAFAQVPGVEGVTASYEPPDNVRWSDAITVTDDKGVHKISLNAMPVDLDFTKTMKMKILSGRDFKQSDFALMDTANNYANYHQPCIINETLARKIGWNPQQAIGKIITKDGPSPVVGVVRDFNFTSLHDPIGPMFIFLGRGYSRDFMIRINGNNLKGTLANLETVWKQRVPDRPFDYNFLNEAYNKLYIAEQRTSTLFGIAASLAIMLACLGLFGLVAFTTIQRTKEIGIRRVLGANVSSIMLLIAKNFLQLVGIAIGIAVPFSWWASHKWLQDFAYRISIQWWVFAIAALGALLIVLLTISFQAIKAAMANTVESLRTE